MSPDWPYTLLLLMVSPAVGSFIGVLVDRLPVGQSILTPSSCSGCGTRLRWGQMVPVLAALRLGHRCATCKTQIPGHLIRIEIAAIAVALAAVLSGQTAVHMWGLALSFWCLVALFYTDLLTMRLPDPLNGAFCIAALLTAWVAPDRSVLEAALTAIGTLIAFALIRAAYGVLRRREGLGLGDVKFAAGFGALLGWQLVPWGLLIAASLALITAAVDRLRTQSPLRGTDAVPFGSYLAGAALLLSVF